VAGLLEWLVRTRIVVLTATQCRWYKKTLPLISDFFYFVAVFLVFAPPGTEPLGRTEGWVWLSVL